LTDLRNVERERRKEMSFGRKIDRSTKKKRSGVPEGFSPAKEVFRRTARELSQSRRCDRCGRLPPDPTPVDFAARQRESLEKALGKERGSQIAYGWARSSVLLSETNGKLVCPCDVRRWNAAMKEYEEKGADVCWAALGVTGDVLKRAEGDRLVELSEERELTAEERARLGELAAWEQSS
jgi:hypothetical protein